MDWNSPTTKKHIAEAEAQGCELLGPGSNKDYRTYRLPCGHEQGMGVKEMREGVFRCRTCLNHKLEAEAEAQGCELLGLGKKDVHARIYRLPCGHEREYHISQMRKGELRCQTCFDNKLKEEAAAQSCELIGPGRNAHIRTYRLECGHEREVGTREMRNGGFRCNTCLDNQWKEQAAVRGCELIGLGRKDSRCRTYRLPCGHESEIRPSRPSTGRT
jgi:hypothetical protein